MAKIRVENNATNWTVGDILAFVHIEKAAGTTFIHILRHNFLLKYLDARPFSRKSQGLFLGRDLRIARRIVPSLHCIAGHAVKPYSDLRSYDRRIKYITIFRDPCKRYVSQYQYWIDRMGKKFSFEEFLELDETRNYQTRKIAGAEELNRAIDILESEMLLTGFVDRYDEFLVMLQAKLGGQSFDPRYRRLNEGRGSVSSEDILNKYRDRIEEVNKIDLELYHYVLKNIYPRQVDEFHGDLQRRLREFQEWNARTGPIMWPRYTDFVFRKAYLEPVTGALRLMNGMPYKGSY